MKKMSIYEGKGSSPKMGKQGKQTERGKLRDKSSGKIPKGAKVATSYTKKMRGK